MALKNLSNDPGRYYDAKSQISNSDRNYNSFRFITDSCEEKFCQFDYTFYSQSFVKLDNLADLHMLFLKKNLVFHVLESSVKGDNCFSYTYTCIVL